MTNVDVPRARSVVVAEDDRATRDALVDLLELHGHVVHVAADGPSAVELILAQRPDTSLIDIGLPLFDGFEVARRVRHDARGAGLRLIALTGHGRREDAERAVAAGFDEHAVKPVDAAELFRLVEQGPG